MLGGLLGDSHARAAAMITVLFTSFVYALFRTPLVSEHPGWRTKAFWGSIISIGGSMALALSEAEIPGLPPGVTRVASLAASSVVAAGYTVSRFTAKQLSQLPD